jgi:hypothetical protein
MLSGVVLFLAAFAMSIFACLKCRADPSRESELQQPLCPPPPQDADHGAPPLLPPHQGYPAPQGYGAPPANTTPYFLDKQEGYGAQPPNTHPYSITKEEGCAAPPPYARNLPTVPQFPPPPQIPECLEQ